MHIYSKCITANPIDANSPLSDTGQIHIPYTIGPKTGPLPYNWIKIFTLKDIKYVILLRLYPFPIPDFILITQNHLINKYLKAF